MKKLFKTILVLAVVAAVAAAVASYVSKKKLESMSDEEIKDFLAQKLEGKVGDEQLETIQNSVIAGVRKTRSATEAVEEGTSDAAESVKDATSDAIETVKDAAGDAKKTAKDAAGDVKKAAKDTAEDLSDVIDEG